MDETASGKALFLFFISQFKKEQLPYNKKLNYFFSEQCVAIRGEDEERIVDGNSRCHKAPCWNLYLHSQQRRWTTSYGRD